MAFTRVRRIKLLCVKTINYAANKNSARNNNNAARSASETNGSLWKSGCRLTKVGNDFIEKALKRWTSMVSGMAVSIQHCWCNISTFVFKVNIINRGRGKREVKRGRRPSKWQAINYGRKKQRSWPTFSRKSAAIKYLLNYKRTWLQLFGHNSFGGLAGCLPLFRFRFATFLAATNWGRAQTIQIEKLYAL